MRGRVRAEPYPDRVEDREAAVAAWVEACNSQGICIEFDQDIMKLVGNHSPHIYCW